MFKSSNELFYDMTIYGLSCCLGGSLKQRILERQSRNNDGDDLTSSCFSQAEKLRTTAIIITILGIISFIIKNRQMIAASVISNESKKKKKPTRISPLALMEQRNIFSLFKYGSDFCTSSVIIQEAIKHLNII